MSVLKPGLNCMGIYEADSNAVLVDACDYYRAFYHTALAARSYLLLAGWQFDSEVKLLRGEEEKAAGEVRFLQFLNALCQANPSLQVYILAWDFSAVFSLEREWFQNIIFNWSGNERIHFRFDSVHAYGATHHQKFVVADGVVAYVGGMDICSSRWDDRRHIRDNPLRADVDGTRYGSYHDIQTYHTGEVVGVLLELFQQRWIDSGGAPLNLPQAGALTPQFPANALPLPAGEVALSLTVAPAPQTTQRKVGEIRRLFVDAIMSAEHLVYLENQYFSSQAIYWTLVARMTLPDRPRLQIVMMLPDRLPLTEELFLGLPQMKMIRSLQQVAEKTGHLLSVYSSAEMDHGNRKMTFIHSKLLAIDDRFLTIGSANATNRSMGLDTELNVSWEASGPEDPLVPAIRRLRASLLAEHAGLYGLEEEEKFENVENLTRHLECLADDHEARLCRYQADPTLEKSDWPDALEPIARVVDPEQPLDSEFLFESISKSELGSFAKGIFKLSQMMIGL
ncbi:putative phospholipase D family protein [Citrifermentans bremense]|uniref:Putative phospholipase D family protein n=1 Tax=Citrifermentans bremense TaxID=60035 RepID=A0A6S6LXL4_9BACT|nr:phospholipase D-like domain-containing protein [Citrifermentans bremense]BCG46752.1 putative phospholipase D family protein [Citrifermentans bremense]